MNRYTIKASVTVDVEISLEADDEDEARATFHDRLAMSAQLVEMGEDEYEVNEDCITDVERIIVEREGQ
jgi:hypothetical protein